MKNVTKYWFLQDFDLMKKMGKMKLMELSQILEMTTINKGEELQFNKGNTQVVYFLKTGTVKVVSSIDGLTKYIVKRGNLFGELPLLDDGSDNDLAIALEECVVCFIEKDQMKEMILDSNQLKNDLLKFNGLRIRKLERRLSDLIYKDSKTRIREYLFDYISEFGEKKEGAVCAKNLLTHSDIAALTSTSRQTVNNVMSELRKEGIIDYNSKTIEIKQI